MILISHKYDNEKKIFSISVAVTFCQSVWDFVTLVGSNLRQFIISHLFHMCTCTLRYRWHHTQSNAMNQLVNSKSCLAMQKEGKNSHFYPVHCYYRDGPPERIFASGFEGSDRPDEQNNELQSDTFLCHRNLQREVSISMPEVTDEQYLNIAEIRQPTISVHTFECISQHHLNWHNKSTPNFQH